MKNTNLAFIYILLFTISAFAQAPASEKPLEELSVDQMMFSHLNAGTNVPDDKAIGGFSSSGNAPKKIDASDVFLPNAIVLVADLNTKTIFDQKYKGIRLLLLNTTGKEQWFSAIDSRLQIIQEAMDTDGKWKPIELLPRSWCGNSYHRVRLGSSEYWEFPAPLYHGSYKTRIRFRLGSDERSAVYSNEFEASVNPGQFTNKPKSPFIF